MFIEFSLLAVPTIPCIFVLNHFMNLSCEKSHIEVQVSHSCRVIGKRFTTMMREG